MQFFLYEIVARIVAIYLCVDCGRELWRGFVERKIKIYSSDFTDWFLDWFLDPPLRIVQRDAAPVRYWIQIAIQTSLVVACFFVAIFGWWHPDT